MPGSAYAWGYSDSGAFGDGTSVSHPTPTQTKGVGGIGFLSGIKGISASRHSLALAADGTVFAWGDNDEGQLGNDGTVDQYTPVQVQLPNAVGPLQNIKQVSAGKLTWGYTTHSLALAAAGIVWAWGNNSSGELGDSTNTQRHTPVQLAGLSDVVQVDGGPGSSFAVHVNGQVSAWGDNTQGQLGDNTLVSRNTPAPVKGFGGAGVLGGIKQVSASFHVLALGWDSQIYAWGRNAEGQLGNGNITFSKTPVQVVKNVNGPPLSNIVAVSAGYQHSLALRSDGAVFAWGNNDGDGKGRLGDGTTTSRLNPVQVKAPAGDPSGEQVLSRIIAVSASYYTSCALRADGKLFTWGDHTALGNGSASGYSTTPVQVSNLIGVTAVAMGATYGLAVV